MQLRGRAGEIFELRIEGYQYASSDDYWDANWLMVGAEVRLPALRWRFRDPCLTTFEARGLAGWLQRAAEGETVEPLGFTEPNFRVAISERSAEGVGLRIWFELEARPPEARDRPWGDFFVALRVGSDELRAAAADLQYELAGYPER